MKLAPCPHCGSVSTGCTVLDVGVDGLPYQVRCESCGARGPEACDIEHAQIAWNAPRVSAPHVDPDPAIARCDELLREIQRIDAAWGMTGRAPAHVQVVRSALVVELRELLLERVPAPAPDDEEISADADG